MNELVETFSNNIEVYKSSRYDEENTKIDFIDKFFAKLGWDVYNASGASEDFREVIREDKVVIEGRPKSPDYSFKIGKERQFFVESKKPSVNIYHDIHSAFQLRRYAYTAGLPISILTNFEEFAIYDTSIKPNEHDSASVARIFYCKYTDYEKQWEFLENTISKQAVWKGKLKKYTSDNTKKKGTQSVDKELLKLIEEWRYNLAKNISLHNKQLDIYQLNEAVQTLIDRLIFLRMAEDRNTEVYGFLQNITKNKEIYQTLVKYFDSSNKKYNSGLFATSHWLDELNIDDKVFKAIINDLYYPMPYEFSVLPIEILGQIYEQFLGKTIVLSPRHVADVIEKPEVRKAGGVYYTPKYIVDYIVENTVGKKVENKAPKDIESLTILDPACGSGSFLVGAYKYLLNYHILYYIDTKNQQKALKDGKIYSAGKDDFRLTIREKKKILLNNIYGVDIDSQAVEVTKLSLLLTLMEGEIVESRGQLFLKSISEALLPNLDNNIKCGNSLIGTDFYNDKDLQLFGKEEQRKINCFDWEVEFPEIFKTSKVNIQDSISKKLQKHSKAAIDNLDSANYHIEKFVEYTQELTDTFVSDTKAEYKIETKEKGGFDCVIGNPPWGADFLVDKNYFIKNYKNLSPDSAAFFLEKAIRLSKELTAFIVPKTISFYSAWESIRKFIIDNTNINNILDAGIAFPEVNLESIILILNKTKFGESPNIFRANPLKRPFIPKEIEFLGKYDKEILKICNIIPHISLTKEESRIIDKLYKNCIKVEDISLKIFRSLYISDADKENLKVGKFKFINKVPDVKRYYIEKVQNINISTNKKWLEKAKRIMVPRVFFKVLRGNRIISYPDVNGEFLTTEKLVNLIIYKEKYPVSELFLSGIMNSKVPSFYLEKVLFSDTTETSRVMDSIYLNHIPVPKIDFSNKTEKAQHDRMVSLVEQMLDAQKEAHSEKNISEKDKQLAQQRIKILDKQIDYLVYELYGLTEEEVKIVEGEGN